MIPEPEARARYEKDIREGCSPSWDELPPITRNAYLSGAKRAQCGKGLGARDGRLHWEPLGRVPVRWED